MVRTRARGTWGSKVQRISPVFASSAYATLHSPVVKITPFETSGVASKPLVVPSSRSQSNPSWPIFCSLIWLKGLKRCSSLVLPYIVQSAPTATAVGGGDFLQAPIEKTSNTTNNGDTLRRIFMRSPVSRNLLLGSKTALIIYP